MLQVPKKIGLLNHVGGGNLGDAGSLDAVIQNIRLTMARRADLGFSMNPDDTERRHAIPSYAIRTQTVETRVWPLPAPIEAVTFREKVKNAVEHLSSDLQGLQGAKETAMSTTVGLFLREIAFLTSRFASCGRSTSGDQRRRPIRRVRRWSHGRDRWALEVPVHDFQVGLARQASARQVASCLTWAPDHS